MKKKSFLCKKNPHYAISVDFLYFFSLYDTKFA